MGTFHGTPIATKDANVCAPFPWPKDKILALMAAYERPARPPKVDLGVGVYKDANGNTSDARR
jgi:hypothetical protein